MLRGQGGDKFDGCLYTDNQGEGTWPYLEQGLLKIDDPYSLKVSSRWPQRARREELECSWVLQVGGSSKRSSGTLLVAL